MQGWRVTGGMSTEALPLPDPAMLPDDPAVLKQMIVQVLEELQKERGARERLEHHLHLLLKRFYGSTSEKFDPRQGLPRTAIGTAADGFPTKSSGRKRSTI